MNFNKCLFILAHQMGESHFYPIYQKLIQNQWKSYDELQKEQELQLKKMINFSYNNVPYYHRLFRNLKLTPEDLKSIEDLEKLPIITKNIIKDNWNELQPVNLKNMKYYNLTTGGSTGNPLRFRLTKFDRFFLGALLYRGWGYGGYELGDKMVFLAGSSLDVGAQSDIVKKSHEIARNLKKLSSFDMGSKEMLSYVNIMNSFKPKFLRGYASSIDFFARYIEENNLEIISPLAIFTTAEKLNPEMRRRISNAFDCEVYDNYGLNDGGVSAYECSEHSGLHIDSERSLMEIVDESGNQIEDGRGKILATSLHNFAMPFIRYETGDLGYITDIKCSCGRGSKVLKEVIGRDKEFLKTPTGKCIHGAAFFNDVFAEITNVNDIIEFQVVQKKIDYIVINIVCKSGFNTNILDPVKDIIQKRSEGWNVEFKVVDNINRTKAGKYKFIISELNN